MAPAPTPEDVENVSFFIKWYQEFLAGAILVLFTWYLKSKGKEEPIYLDADDIEQRMTICKQSILLAMKEELDERDERLMNRIKELMK